MNRLLPLIAFLALAVLLLIGLENADRKSEIPSPLIDKPAPEFTLPVLGNSARTVSRADMLGQPYLLNVWASWCYACRIEHPVVTDLAESGLVPVYGLNYKDEPEEARRWLTNFGDPYVLSLADYSGRTAIDFGVYGAPETFLVDGQGRIRYKYIGPMTEEVINNELKPVLAAIQSGGAGNDPDGTP